MAVSKHHIAYYWIKQTLVPFLHYAFAATLPYPADISVQIQQAIDFCLHKPDHPSDGDDLVFERIFMAIMHRHKNLAPDLEVVVGNLEPLAKYLIRRAQLKGPYELLGRSDIGSGAWVEHERRRLSNLELEPEEADNGGSYAQQQVKVWPDRLPELRPPARPPPTQTKLPPAECDIDPRLVYAQPGHFAATDLPAELTADEDSLYRCQNHELEQYHSRRPQQDIHSPTALIQVSNSPYMLPGTALVNAPITYSSSYRQQQQPPQQPAPAPVYTQQVKQQTPPLWHTSKYASSSTCADVAASSRLYKHIRMDCAHAAIYSCAAFTNAAPVSSNSLDSVPTSSTFRSTTTVQSANQADWIFHSAPSNLVSSAAILRVTLRFTAHTIVDHSKQGLRPPPRQRLDQCRTAASPGDRCQSDSA